MRIIASLTVQLTFSDHRSPNPDERSLGPIPLLPKPVFGRGKAVTFLSFQHFSLLYRFINLQIKPMPGFVDISDFLTTKHQAYSRIISVVPSLTELLSDLNLNDEVIGITKFCIRPKHWYNSKIKIGGTKNLHLQQISQLKPDLIIANKEENEKEQVLQLAANYDVWLTDINTIHDAIQTIYHCGILTNRSREAEKLVAAINHQFFSLNEIHQKQTTCYLIWRNPYMTVGGDTFIDAMMNAAGLENVFHDSSRYPIVTFADIAAKKPSLILLSSEPYPFKEQHIDEIKRGVPDTAILLVDGEMFSWYGSRMLQAPTYFLNLWRHGLH
ncbi:MAG: helical backbone metal receptor [Chitinophagaceae bacterium]